MRATLMVPIKDRSHFLDMYFQKAGLGGLFVGGIAELDLGDEVDLDITFLNEQMSFRVRGQVRWRRTLGGRRSLPPGLGIEFLADQRAAEKKLVDFALGREVSLVHREGRRYGASLKVQHRRENGELRRTDRTDDISEGGCFLLTEAPLKVGEVVRMSIRPPGALFGVQARARVAWRREGPRRGVGVEFLFDSARKKAQVERLVRQLKTRMIRELKVRVPRGQ